MMSGWDRRRDTHAHEPLHEGEERPVHRCSELPACRDDLVRRRDHRRVRGKLLSGLRLCIVARRVVVVRRVQRWVVQRSCPLRPFRIHSLHLSERIAYDIVQSFQRSERHGE